MSVAGKSVKIVAEREHRDEDELAASRRIMVQQLGRQIVWLAARHGLSPDVVEQNRIPPVDSEDQPPEQVGWLDIESAVSSNPETGTALWQRVKDEARRELQAGIRVATSLERPLNATPFERAQYLAVVEALSEAVRPRDGLELVLVHQMAAAYEQHLRWQALAVQRAEENAWQGERDRQRAFDRMSRRERARAEVDDGWMPPRLDQAEAIEQAVMMADRYQRAFLRLLRALRDQRRVFDALVVAGGQVNIAGQQINVAE